MGLYRSKVNGSWFEYQDGRGVMLCSRLSVACVVHENAMNQLNGDSFANT